MNSSLSFGEESGIPPVPELHHHPKETESFKFPKRCFRKTKIVERSFQPCFFDKWPFLHYDEVVDRVFCHTCMNALPSLLCHPCMDLPVSSFVSHSLLLTKQSVGLAVACAFVTDIVCIFIVVILIAEVLFEQFLIRNAV